jgi:folate-dependent tRNA-U54 methylase TrmFO/GidA
MCAECCNCICDPIRFFVERGAQHKTQSRACANGQMDRQTDSTIRSFFVILYLQERHSTLFWMTTGSQTGLRSEAQRAGLRKLPGKTVGARKPLHAATREESINNCLDIAFTCPVQPCTTPTEQVRECCSQH